MATCVRNICTESIKIW